MVANICIHRNNIIGDFRFEYEYEIEYENDFSIPFCKPHIITSLYHLIS